MSPPRTALVKGYVATAPLEMMTRRKVKWINISTLNCYWLIFSRSIPTLQSGVIPMLQYWQVKLNTMTSIVLFEGWRQSMSVCLSVCLSTCLSIYLSVYLSVGLPVGWSVSQPVSQLANRVLWRKGLNCNSKIMKSYLGSGTSCPWWFSR